MKVWSRAKRPSHMSPARAVFTLSVLRMGWRLPAVRGRVKGTAASAADVSGGAEGVGVGDGAAAGAQGQGEDQGGETEWFHSRLLGMEKSEKRRPISLFSLFRVIEVE